MTALVTDTEHYTKVLNLAAMAKRTLWYGAAINSVPSNFHIRKALPCDKWEKEV